MKKIDAFIVFLLCLGFGLAGCGGSSELQENPAGSLQPSLFDDFEGGVLGGGGWTWGDTLNGSSCTFTSSKTTPKFGLSCGKIDYKGGKGWGCGAAESSPYEGKGFDAASWKSICLWVKAPDSLSFKVQLTSHQDNKIYPFVSPPQQGLGRWLFYKINLAVFTPEVPLPQGLEKLSHVDSVGFIFPGNQRDGTLLVDNIYFQ